MCYGKDVHRRPISSLHVLRPRKGSDYALLQCRPIATAVCRQACIRFTSPSVVCRFDCACAGSTRQRSPLSGSNAARQACEDTVVFRHGRTDSETDGFMHDIWSTDHPKGATKNRSAAPVPDSPSGHDSRQLSRVGPVRSARSTSCPVRLPRDYLVHNHSSSHAGFDSLPQRQFSDCIGRGLRMHVSRFRFAVSRRIAQ